MDIGTWATVGTSVVAVAGTLAGTVLAGWMHGRTSRATQSVADDKARRQEVLTTVTALVAALDDHRRAQLVRVRGRARVIASGGDVAVADEHYTAVVHQTRSAVTGPSVTLRIMCPALAGAAERAVEATFAIREAESLADVEHRRQQSKLVCDALVSEAGRLLAPTI
ncbi:hypothetical protein [Streptomyces sp. NRRL B-24484]|uniref:hypothetical protein n=1 Tax=Streptomyces sp. NRRL B-24484 TaxID=1463833 RepID=UPI000694F307|nr:hypothetical protein [Streptomyces sp. NRRL B-24484]